MSLPRASSWTLTARWVFPVDGPPLEQGTVTICGERIEAVEPHGRRSADHDLGNAAILPGLVNAHTHLDLTGLRGQCPPSTDFTSWLRAVIQHRRNTSGAQIKQDIRAGLAESLAHGTTLLGDISGQGESWDVLVSAPVRAVIFRELLGLTADRAKQAQETAESWLRAHGPTPTCWPGLSPHAPYSVRGSLLQVIEWLARNYDAPLSVHLAESQAELQLLRSHEGPFVPFLSDLGVWDVEGLAGDETDFVSLTRAGTPTLLVHGNYLTPFTAIRRNGTVVYCPRTHAAFGHTLHPFREFSTRGVRVALGTDSLASNPDLNVLGEVRYLHEQFPEIPGAVLLELATQAGAEALGWERETGTLAPGKSADLLLLKLPSADAADPHELLLSAAASVLGVLFRGQWVSTVAPTCS
jgi:cytosine/adenosine deaminase-related metal-dependent hydrolase